MSEQKMSRIAGINKAYRKSKILERRLAHERLEQRNPELAHKLSQMRLTIAPIVHIETGKPPPEYPSSMLSLFLLTESQLDAMAKFYSQDTETELTYQYPSLMNWTQPFLDKDPLLPDDCVLSDLERVKVKMRMFAGFIGMQGTETPLWEHQRQLEILHNKIKHVIRQEERDEGDDSNRGGSKFYQGPSTRRPRR